MLECMKNVVRVKRASPWALPQMNLDAVVPICIFMYFNEYKGQLAKRCCHCGWRNAHPPSHDWWCVDSL